MEENSEMKKGVILLLIGVILLSFAGCGLPIDIDSLSISKNSQYVLEPKTCKTLIGGTPAEAETVLANSHWVEGHFQSAVEDEEGNLVLTLSKKDKEHWENHINQVINNRIELDAADGYKFIVGDDYKSIETHTTKEVYLADGYNIMRISLFCGIMQMLNGEDINNWYIDIKMVDLETGALIKEVRFPENNLNVTDEDWERALNGAEDDFATVK